MKNERLLNSLGNESLNVEPETVTEATAVVILVRCLAYNL